MLYLEDYLEMIEQLPMDFRERFTEMREMDLQVQNDMDNMDEKVKTFFEAAKKEKTEQKQKEFENIRKEYYKILDDCDEKVQVANQMYDLIDRYLRKLDQELSKFKMELEADNAGITELLERRSLQLDQPPKVVPVKGEKRKLQSIENHLPNKVTSTSPSDDLLSTLATEAAQEIPSYRVSTSTTNSSTINTNSARTSGGGSGAESRGGGGAAAAEISSPQPALSYSLGHVGAGSNAIAMAAAQAVSNTLQMQQGRRTASLKASYEALKSHGFSLNLGSREYGSSGNSNSASGSSPSTSESSRNQRSRRQTHKAAAIAQAAQEKQQHQQQQHQAQGSTQGGAFPAQSEGGGGPQQPVVELQPGGASSEDSVAAAAATAATGAATPVEWTYDPNEPRYCLCNQVSYGEMVGCDNDNCPIEWFHYGCVGITNPPKGKWYCPQCAAAMKRREKKGDKR